MISVKIESEFVKLEQFLEFASIAQTGGMVRELIKKSLVKASDKAETRRGKKFYPGNAAESGREKYIVE